MLHLAFAVLVAFACASAWPVVDDPGFDYILLATFWPSAGCLSDDLVAGKCGIPVATSTFTVHGIWPSAFSTSPDPPNNCAGPAYDADLLSPIWDRLVVEWPDYLYPDHPTFYTHEWSKHGTCFLEAGIPQLTGELNYFSFGLQLIEGLPLENALRVAGIYPSAARAYSFDDLQAALGSYFGFQPFVQCTSDHFSHTILRSVNVCFDLSLAPVDCPADRIEASRSGCSGHSGAIYWLPWVGEP
jgi:ribonuclease I